MYGSGWVNFCLVLGKRGEENPGTAGSTDPKLFENCLKPSEFSKNVRTFLNNARKFPCKDSQKKIEYGEYRIARVVPRTDIRKCKEKNNFLNFATF